MDIENLSKSELLFSALLLAFVAAIFTGVVMTLLKEPAPTSTTEISLNATSAADEKDLEFATSATDDRTATNTGAASGSEQATFSKEEVISSVVPAVARVRATDDAIRAGVFVEMAGRKLIITSDAITTPEAEALFESGVVAHLDFLDTVGAFSRYQLASSTGAVSALPTAKNLPTSNELFAVPLRQQPEIIAVSQRSADQRSMKTSAKTLPHTSPLLSRAGELIGFYDTAAANFQLISTFSAN